MRREIEAAGWTLNETRRGIGAANGTAVHDAAAFTMLSKIADGSLGNQTEAEQRALASLAAQVEEGPILWDDTTPERNTAERQVLAQVRSYRASLAPKLKPIAVELALQAEIKPGFILAGHPDELEEIGFTDTKTGRNNPNHSAQLGAYSLLIRSHRKGEGADKAAILYLPRTRKTPQPAPSVIPYDPMRCEQVADRIVKRAVRDIEEFRATGDINVFMANPQSQLCSERFCPLWGTKTCSAWKAKT